MLNIKASNITNLTDARYFAAKEVAWLGFNFIEGAPQYIEPMKARAMFEWVEGPRIIGHFAVKTAAEARFFAENWGLSAVEVEGDLPLAELAALDGLAVVVSVNEWTAATDLRAYLTERRPYVTAFQLNFSTKNETFEALVAGKASVSLAELEALCHDFPLILNLDFEAAAVADIARLPLAALNLTGGEEERIGVKSFDDLDDIFDILEEIA